jgi:hypothetical protein
MHGSRPIKLLDAWHQSDCCRTKKKITGGFGWIGGLQKLGWAFLHLFKKNCSEITSSLLFLAAFF